MFTHFYDFSSNGRGRQGQRDQARNERHQSAGLSGHFIQAPSAEELDHDFLWRCQVHCLSADESAFLTARITKRCWSSACIPRYCKASSCRTKLRRTRTSGKSVIRQIRDWEDTLAENGTHVIKFFLNVSKDEQKKRFLDRIEQPDKNWKFSAGDAKERALWDEYMNAYADAMSATSTDNSPWYIIPADKKWFTRLAVSEIIVKTLASLDIKYPELTAEHRAELAECRKMLESGK